MHCYLSEAIEMWIRLYLFSGIQWLLDTFEFQIYDMIIVWVPRFQDIQLHLKSEFKIWVMWNLPHNTKLIIYIR